MAQIGVSITKKAAFRDAVQEFSNVYHYGWVGLNPGEDLAEDFIDAITAIEKTFHSSEVTFLRGRVWSSGGTIAENQMIAEKVLTGVGATTPNTTFDVERAFLFQWPAGLDSRGHPVTLKKWYHSCGAFGSIAVASGVLKNTTGISDSQRDTMETYVDPLHPLAVGTLGQEYDLIAESGREAEYGCVAHKYLEHHQLGDMWRT